MELKGKKLNALGDSITQGVGVAKAENIFPAVLAEKEGLAVARNYGISGTRIAAQQGPYDNLPAYCDRFGGMDDDADIIVIFGGTNDYGHGNAPFGCFDDRTRDTYCGAWHVLLSGLIEKYPAATIVVMTPIHRCNENAPSQFNGRPLIDYVNAAKEIAAYYSIPVLDLWTMGGIQPENPVMKARYCPDGLHPNDAGHALIAQRLAGFLKTL